jgi:hypothetical protein
MDRQTNTRDRDRGQAFTLEAITAAVVILGSVLFALQVAGVTSLTASTSGGDLTEQQEAVAAGILDTAVANGSIHRTLRYWDPQNDTFHRVSEIDENFYTMAPPTAFGAHLNRTLELRAAYNVNIHYLDENGTVQRQALVRNGMPSDDAARATRTVTLYDGDRLLSANGTASNATLGNTSVYLPDRYPGGPVYNVVRVEVVVWPI